MAESTFVNPSTALSTVLVDELVRGGVRDIVLCPGSRSAPLAYAAQRAERDGRVRVHVRVDERSAGFLALGLAKGAGSPAAVVTTSGTAVANLHPAVLEAHHGGVPLVVVSADRPHELRGVRANQTTVQPGMFGRAVRREVVLPRPEPRSGQNAWWRAAVGRLLAAARGGGWSGGAGREVGGEVRTGPAGSGSGGQDPPLDAGDVDSGLGAGDPGPVHLDVAFADPLVPSGESEWPEPLDGRADGAPWVEVRAPWATGAMAASLVARPLEHVERTVVVVGDLPDPGVTGSLSRAAVAWARARDYPVVTEPFGLLERGTRLPHGPLLLTATDWVLANRPDRVVVIGRPTLSRAVAGLLRLPGVRLEVVGAGASWAAGSWADPSSGAAAVHPFAALAADGPPEPGDTAGALERAGSAWTQAWHEAGRAVAEAVADAGGPGPWPTGLSVAAVLAQALPAGARLFVGSSNPARDLDLGAAPDGRDLHVVANRGLAGIDGCVSTAAGIALSTTHPTYAWLGDLTFLHDANGLVVGALEPGPDLTVIVTNDDGGGIFSTLEHGEPRWAADAERVLGTPTGTDLTALCRAHGVTHVPAGTPEELTVAVSQRPSGVTAVEVEVDRESHRPAHERLRRIAAAAVLRS